MWDGLLFKFVNEENRYTVLQCMPWNLERIIAHQAGKFSWSHNNRETEFENMFSPSITVTWGTSTKSQSSASQILAS
jgi:hypothetical protein